MGNLTIFRVESKRWNLLIVTKIDENLESDWIAIITFIFARPRRRISTVLGARTIPNEQASLHRQPWTLK